jgi:hypothetical protein
VTCEAPPGSRCVAGCIDKISPLDIDKTENIAKPMPFDDLQRYKTVLGGILPVEKERSCSLKYKNGAVIPETAPSGILPGGYRP